MHLVCSVADLGNIKSSGVWCYSPQRRATPKGCTLRAVSNQLLERQYGVDAPDTTSVLHLATGRGTGVGVLRPYTGYQP